MFRVSKDLRTYNVSSQLTLLTLINWNGKQMQHKHTVRPASDDQPLTTFCHMRSDLVSTVGPSLLVRMPVTSRSVNRSMWHLFYNTIWNGSIGKEHFILQNIICSCNMGRKIINLSGGHPPDIRRISTGFPPVCGQWASRSGGYPADIHRRDLWFSGPEVSKTSATRIILLNRLQLG